MAGFLFLGMNRRGPFSYEWIVPFSGYETPE